MKRLKYLGGVLLVLSLILALAGVVSAQQTVTVPINPVAGSGVSGTATLTAVGNTTTVSLSVSGFAPNTSHATHIHTGTCANPGGIVIDLPTLTADASGAASATATVNASLASLMDGNHIIQTHVTSGANFGAGVACGDIPVTAVAAATPAATVAVAAATATPAAVAAAPAVTGGPEPLMAAALLAALGSFVLGSSMLLRRR